MLKQTNLAEVKDVYKAFLYLPVEETDVSPIVVQHPIFEGAFQPLHKTKDNGEPSYEIVNVLEDENGLDMIRKSLCDTVDKCNSIAEVYNMVRRSYWMTFLKFAKPYLSKHDFSELLSDAWVNSENPNQDVNVSTNLAVMWFRQADKKVIMNKEEYEIYNNFKSGTVLYRGVSVGRNPNGLSWTDDYDTANWFAHRFDIDGKCGYVQSAVVNKENVLCYFDHEKEYVVDSRKVKIKVEDC